MDRIRGTGDGRGPDTMPTPASGPHPPTPGNATGWRAALAARFRALVRAINDGDDATVERALLDLSRSRRWLAPLGLVLGAFVMLFDGVKLLFSNWRLTLIELLPALWIWLAMFDLKVHLLRGQSFHVVRGLILIPLVAAVAAITVAAFYLNTVFGFAVGRPGRPDIRRSFADAASHRRAILGWGTTVGVCLGVATLVFPRWGRWWFAVSLSIVVGIMMVSYVSVPSRLLGLKASISRRDQLSATAIGGVIGAVICIPPYVMGRVGLLMLDSRILFAVGVVLIALGVTLHAGATGAVKAIKMSAQLLAGRGPKKPEG